MASCPKCVGKLYTSTRNLALTVTKMLMLLFTCKWLWPKAIQMAVSWENLMQKLGTLSAKLLFDVELVCRFGLRLLVLFGGRKPELR